MKEKGHFYTGVYMDFQGRGLTVTVGSGFKDSNGKPAGVACMDFDLSALYRKTGEKTLTSTGNGMNRPRPCSKAKNCN